MPDHVTCPRCGHEPAKPPPAWISRIPVLGAYYQRHVATTCGEGVEGPSGWGEACGCSHAFHHYHLLTQRAG